MQSGRIIDPGVNGMDALAILETQVRDLVRDNGVDPARDSATVAKLIRGAVLAYDQRSLAGTRSEERRVGRACRRRRGRGRGEGTDGAERTRENGQREP